jgi:uncharacterized membrane protein
VTSANPTLAPGRPSFRWRLFLLLAAELLVAQFLLRFVLPYLSLEPAYYDYLWPRRFGLWAHLAGGAVAVVIGPIQLWLGATGRRGGLHRTLGKVYLGSVAIGCLAGYYLAAMALPTNWVYGSGLLGLAVAWTVTTGMAYLAIRRRQIEQHREWMIRSCVVTFSFVFFRVFIDVVHAFGLKSATDEEYKIAAWLCWAVPLLLVEPLLQLRKLRRPGEAPSPS